MSDRHWFYKFDGNECGPVATDELRFLINSGTIRREIRVRAMGSTEWMTVEEARILSAAPPVRTKLSGLQSAPAPFRRPKLPEISAVAAISEAAPKSGVPPGSLPRPATPPLPPAQRGDGRMYAVAGTVGLILVLLLLLAVWPEGDSASGIAGTDNGAGSSSTGSAEASGNGASENFAGTEDALAETENAGADTAVDAPSSSASESAAADSAVAGTEVESSQSGSAAGANAITDDTAIGIVSDASPSEDEGLAVGEDSGSRFSVSAPGETTFFGIRGAGRRFAYVVDCSGSMQGEPLERAKKELLESIQRLPSHVEFRIVFFDDLAYQFPAEGLKDLFADASSKSKKSAEQWIIGINPGGGTNVKLGMNEVLKHRRIPDAVFLLTDGAFESDTPAYVRSINQKKVRVNTVAFVSRDGEALLTQIARQNRGDFRFVP